MNRSTVISIFREHRAIVIAILAIVVLGAGVIVILNIYTQKERITTAPAGEVVANFPKSLILEKGISIEQSYSINYQGGAVIQPVVKYISEKSMGDNVNEFKNYLTQNGWTITHEANPNLAITFFSATKQSEKVNITLAVDRISQKITVTIAHATFQ